jgi:hypothetical protein
MVVNSNEILMAVELLGRFEKKRYWIVTGDIVNSQKQISHSYTTVCTRE